MIKLIPAWGSFSEWKEANQALDYLIARYKNDLSRAVGLAREIQKNLEGIFPLQDGLCRETCSHCPDPCCLNATVWANFTDILFFHLTGQDIPEKQLIEKAGDSCIYHSSKGCTLPRLSRPFTCTLYICPFQIAKFRLFDSETKKDYEKKIAFIKKGRRELEDLFVELSSRGIRK